jgi:hypothetical protein
MCRLQTVDIIPAFAEGNDPCESALRLSPMCRHVRHPQPHPQIKQKALILSYGFDGFAINPSPLKPGQVPKQQSVFPVTTELESSLSYPIRSSSETPTVALELGQAYAGKDRLQTVEIIQAFAQGNPSDRATVLITLSGGRLIASESNLSVQGDCRL